MFYTQGYKYKFHFNAMHNLNLKPPGNMHAHTFRVYIYVESQNEKFEKFDICESAVKEYFKQYDGVHMNDIEPFRTVLPTIENMCQVFYEDISNILQGLGLELIKLELGDSPLATYSVGKKLLVGSVNNRVREESFETYKRILQNSEESWEE